MSGKASASSSSRGRHTGGNLRKSDRTRRAILDSALEFLWTRPFRELTVSELMEMTDAGRSAFYQYFSDVYEVMEVLLEKLEEDILSQAGPWFTGHGDPVALLNESVDALVNIGHERGPLMRAVAEAAPTDARLERAWDDLLKRFDDAIAARIQADQAQQLIPPFEARPVAIALNRMDVAVLIHAFGRRPRAKKPAVRESLTRVWNTTLYGAKAVGSWRSKS
jgi:AcrR family transcriptional regulator